MKQNRKRHNKRVRAFIASETLRISGMCLGCPYEGCTRQGCAHSPEYGECSLITITTRCKYQQPCCNSCGNDCEAYDPRGWAEYYARQRFSKKGPHYMRSFTF